MATEKDFLGQQLYRMAVNWRLTSLSPEDRATQKREFKPLLDKWGEGKFRATVDRCISQHSSGFFPSVGEFQAYETKPMGTTDLRTCPSCCNSEGWVFLDYEYTDNSGQVHQVRNAAKRCTHGRPA